MFSASLGLDDEDKLQLQNMLKNRQDELILIDTDRIAHSFQDPIFKELLEKHIQEHKMKNGEYD